MSWVANPQVPEAWTNQYETFFIVSGHPPTHRHARMHPCMPVCVCVCSLIHSHILTHLDSLTMRNWVNRYCEMEVERPDPTWVVRVSVRTVLFMPAQKNKPIHLAFLPSSNFIFHIVWAVIRSTSHYFIHSSIHHLPMDLHSFHHPSIPPSSQPFTLQLPITPSTHPSLRPTIIQSAMHLYIHPFIPPSVKPVHPASYRTYRAYCKTTKDLRSSEQMGKTSLTTTTTWEN